MDSIQAYYKRHKLGEPPAPHPGVGHFNVFKHDPFTAQPDPIVSYQRRDYFKIMLAFGHFGVNYADKAIQIRKQALLFCNPFIPYQIEAFDKVQAVVYCMFSCDFFYHFGQLSDFWVFQPGTPKVFELTDIQTQRIHLIFEKMQEEMDSEYVYKYQLIRNFTQELAHLAMKMEPSESKRVGLQSNASQRISELFLELLERQFPIDETHRKIHLKTPAQFARHLNVHVNHLNRALKLTTNKTSSQLIAKRIIQESKILLKQSTWNISEVALALGFEEPAYFSNFFKKHTHVSPTEYRRQ